MMQKQFASIRKRAGGWVFENAFNNLARLGRLHPRANPDVHNVDALYHIPYATTGSTAHTLDVYRLRQASGPRPVVLYIHGGAFRILSKDTHWFMALKFARKGYVVFNINYRLAPEHPYPAALEDAALALRWVHENAARFGGDPGRIVLAGESAGANLVTSLAIAATFPRPEPFARAVHDAGVKVAAVLPACGILQVTDCDRFRRKGKLPFYILDRMDEMSHGYLGGRSDGVDLADPLVVLERTDRLGSRPLPPFFTFVGTRDPVLDDTRRLHAALQKLEVPCEVRYFPGELHAFHALIWRPAAVALWRESFEWLSRVVT